jgi:hypothetical protein
MHFTFRARTSLPLYRTSACIMEQEKWMCLHIYPSLVEKVLVSRDSIAIPNISSQFVETWEDTSI